MEQKIVVHRQDGKILKGVTQEFDPSLDEFHFLPAEGGGVPLRLKVQELKALFWVRDYLGNRHFVARRSFDEVQEDGRPAIVTFQDGEEVWGTVGQDTEAKAGFFLFPADRQDNNVRIFVVRSAMKGMRLVDN